MNKQGSEGVFPVHFMALVFRLESLAGMHCIEVPVAVVNKLGAYKKKRLICTLNQSISWQCGLVSLSGGKAYFSINPARRKKLNLQEGSRVLVEFEPDHSEYGMEMPAELQALLQQDAIGRDRFDALKAGMQRYILYYVNQVKNEQKRIDRAIMLIENLKKLHPGKETFRDILGLPPRED